MEASNPGTFGFSFNPSDAPAMLRVLHRLLAAAAQAEFDLDNAELQQSQGVLRPCNELVVGGFDEWSVCDCRHCEIRELRRQASALHFAARVVREEMAK